MNDQLLLALQCRPHKRHKALVSNAFMTQNAADKDVLPIQLDVSVLSYLAVALHLNRIFRTFGAAT